MTSCNADGVLFVFMKPHILPHRPHDFFEEVLDELEHVEPHAPEDARPTGDDVSTSKAQ